MTLIKKIANSIAKTEFGCRAINDGANLRIFKEQLTTQSYFGITLMLCSYIIGWPMVVLISAFSVLLNEPLLIIIGGPLLLIISHLIFIAGMYLAGGKYVMVVFRWATKTILEKLI